jgi:hypothetical protein
MTQGRGAAASSLGRAPIHQVERFTGGQTLADAGVSVARRPGTGAGDTRPRAAAMILPPTLAQQRPQPVRSCRIRVGDLHIR